ncbi:Demethylrebeccamycin-D-glucose O-methyltransferase (plasmid) [Streptomyces sp. ADI95-16]|uniref:SAM-dependent methyltransferase n=1 Tax=unclassified Streptomyces TaxID=2593676 RepID=UPI000F3AA85A|nr:MULTISPECIES: class I SAM-dependent methyltransferase [unclassified Streptomyces]AYV33090.1 Demethylrebeccamycin-D-glucose O-methyltransferase [Streptomyces sp. ADI95-16]RPK24643.1 Demethylrebeccamycin-D-glucose O-methyltransferase [Streptomyces sp. ADI91-18]
MSTRTAEAITGGERWDQSSPVSDVFNDGQAHLSYWYGPDDATPMAEASRRLTRKVADVLGVRRGDRLLDAGCGPGGPSLQMAEETGATVTGVTISRFEADAGTRKAAERGLSGVASFEHGDYARLGHHPDGSFDAVMAMESLQYAPDLSEALAELFRILRAGGALTMTDYTLAPGVGRDERDQLADRLALPHLQPVEGWLEALEAAGFAVEEYTQCGPRVFGLGPKYVEAAEQTRHKLAAAFGEEAVSGLKDAMADFFSPGAERIAYSIVTVRKPRN